MKKLLLGLIFSIPLIGFGQVTINGNGNSGFGGFLGNGDITISDDGTTITFTVNGAASIGTNAMVIYIDSESGGFSNTSSFTDQGDGLRIAISGNERANRSIANFPPGFHADYALAFNTGFAGLWQLVNSGSHTFVKSASLGNPSTDTYTLQVDFSDLNTTDVATSFNFLSSIISTTAFRSDEATGQGIASGNPGWTPVTFTTYHQYGSGSEGGVVATTGIGSWSTPGIWSNGNVPLEGDQVSVNHNLTLNQDASVSSLTIASGVAFTASDATPRTLTISRDANGSATTITNSGGTWANGTGGSTVVFAGTPNSGDAIHQTSGTLAFQNVTIEKTGGANNVGVDFQTSSSVSGTLEIGTGGYVSTAPPTSFYGGSAILAFDQGVSANYNVGASDNSWSTTEIPQNITVSSGTVTLNSDRTASGALIVSNGATLEVSANSDLTIGGNFDLDGTTNLRATSSGYAQLKVSGILSNNGTINHEQYFTGGWQMVAASMNATSASYFGNVGTNATGGTANTQNLFSWDGTQYVNVADNSELISPGMGYFGYVGTYGFRDNANTTYSFTGTPNTSVTPSLTFATSIADMTAGALGDDGWNLVANPFTCALDFTTISRTAVNDAFYIFDPSTSGYQSYSTGGISVGHIAPMQSFWVQANAGSPSLGTLTMSANGTVASAPQLYKTGINFDRLVLRTAALNDSTAVDYTVVSFIENNSDHAYDSDWDARKFYNAGELPNIYSTFKGEEMAVNAIDFGPSSTTTGSIDISYRAPHVGNTYEISFDKDYMLYRYMVVLEDKKTGTFTNLGESNYQFNFDDTYIDRFVLHFNAQGIGMEDLISNAGKATLEAWAFDGAIHYQANYGGSAELILIDLSGQNVWTSSIEFNQGERASLELGDIKAGVYLLKSTDAEGRSNTTKVYLK